ncbi:hypothetical protein JZ751_014215 [Albula glossodonta]|uniref:Uncharacterized protein n=1 Tax=Albula glossodonta TaxID=121402 RepID=A0A8T2NUQ7_9TELE|nr:hypothetical protein JZ751_014215 [Albula glossodonta]
MTMASFGVALVQREVRREKRNCVPFSSVSRVVPAPATLTHCSMTWSYSLREARKIREVTFSKQWIHFLRSDL